MSPVFRWIFLCIILFGGEETTYGVQWVAFGELRGKLEPCGCNPISNLGGIERLSRFLESERSKDPSVVVIDLGGHFSKKKDAFEDKMIRKALRIIQPDVVLDRGEGLSGKLLLDGNTVWTREETVILGIVDTIPAEETVRKKTKSYTEKILVFHGSDVDLKKVLSWQIFTTVLSTNTAPLSVEPDGRERSNEKLLWRVDGVAQMVPLGAQGVLFGGKNLEMFKNVSEIFSEDTQPVFKTEQKYSWESQVRVRWLDTSYEGSSKIQSVLEEYAEGSEKEFLKGKKSRLEQLKKTRFIGARSCEPCHQKEYEIWKNSDHASAFPTLKKENKHRDVSCIGCHVVGWEDGGYVDHNETNHFAGVQCENCHGAGKEHQKTLKKFEKIPQNTCVECHHGQHSPDFDFKKYWKKIEHGKSK